MSDTEIETVIRRLLLFNKSIKNKENEKHIEDLQNQLIKICEKFHFFNKKIISNKIINDKEGMILNVIKSLEFIYKNENEVIWKVGDKVNEMYIIFLGEVNIYKQQNKNEIEESPQLSHILEKGYSLGEEYIKFGQIRRRYLTTTKSYCILGKLNKKEYNRIFNRNLNEENILINSFLKDLKLFNSDFIERFQKFTIIKYLNKNEYVFKQGEEFNTFYFIISGTIRLTVNLNKSVKSKIDENILIGKNIERFTTSRLFEIRGFYKELINYNIIDLTQGDIIGGIEYYNHYNNYKYNAKCLNNVEVLKFDLNHFNIIKNEEEMKIFYGKINNQTELISNRIQQIKEGRQQRKINDYIFSKNKFTKAFLLNNPLTKKGERRAELYINSSSNPFKIKQTYSKKKFIKSKIFLNINKDDYKYQKKQFQSTKSIKIKDFLTNIDYNNRIPVGQIFSPCFSEESIPDNNSKKVYYLNNNSDSNKMDFNDTKLKRMFKNKTISSSLSTPLELKDEKKKKKVKINIKSNSIKYISNKFHIKKTIFNNSKIREKLYSANKSKKNLEIKDLLSNVNSFKSFNLKQFIDN